MNREQRQVWFAQKNARRRLERKRLGARYVEVRAARREVAGAFGRVTGTDEKRYQ